MENALDWKPRPFTEEELRDIDPVIRYYMERLDVRPLVENRRLTVEQRMIKALARAREAAASLHSTGQAQAKS